MAQPTDLYLDLLERSLINTLYPDIPTTNGQATSSLDQWASSRYEGRDWPSLAFTMIGALRLRSLRQLCEEVLKQQIPGDFLEAGVWRGGASILMRGVLAAHQETQRSLWCADSFRGLPPPEPAFPADQGDLHHTFEELRISRAQVEANFATFGLLDAQVRFLEGWFADTLPGAPVKSLAILRLDGDMYSSTWQTLEALYSRVSVGGYIIVDDYALSGCQKAVDDFRALYQISDPLVKVDWTAAYWCKDKPPVQPVRPPPIPPATLIQTAITDCSYQDLLHRFEAVSQSRSWRITAPLRALGRWLRRLR
jgi:O-methyltransferase